jgi:hypothetical protein
MDRQIIQRKEREEEIISMRIERKKEIDRDVLLDNIIICHLDSRYKKIDLFYSDDLPDLIYDFLPQDIVNIVFKYLFSNEILENCFNITEEESEQWNDQKIIAHIEEYSKKTRPWTRHEIIGWRYYEFNKIDEEYVVINIYSLELGIHMYNKSSCINWYPKKISVSELIDDHKFGEVDLHSVLDSIDHVYGIYNRYKEHIDYGGWINNGTEKFEFY